MRQLYYQFVSRDLLANRQSEYKRLGSVINDARLAGLIDWSAIEDRTRNLRSISTWSEPFEIISGAAHQYKEDLWEQQEVRLEVWIEKDALIGVIEPACSRWRVPYFACRGYASQSEEYSAGKRFEDMMNTGIAAALDGDPVHDVDRIMRLPGTTNHSTLKKRARGLVGGPVRVLAACSQPAATYTIEELKQSYEPIAGADQKDRGDAAVQATLDALDWNAARAGASPASQASPSAPQMPQAGTSLADALPGATLPMLNPVAVPVPTGPDPAVQARQEQAAREQRAQADQQQKRALLSVSAFYR